MSTTVLGIAVGAVVSLTWIAFGFWAAVLVSVAMLLGAGVGRMLEGRLDVRAILDAVRGGRSSS